MSNFQAKLQDVAKAANVSIGTVDRVLHRRGRVSKEAERKVLEAVLALDYRPSQIARALSVRKRNIKIGITYPYVESEFWAEIISGIERARNELIPFGVELIVKYNNAYEITDQLKCISELVEQGINGLLLTPLSNSSADHFQDILNDTIPYGTVIDDVIESKRVFHIGPDDFAMGVLAAKLTSLYINPKCNVVVLSANTDLRATQLRISGYLSKIKQDHLDINVLRIYPIAGGTEQECYANINDAVIDCMSKYSSLNAFYVTNGLTEWAAAAVEKTGRADDFHIIGHEYTSGIVKYLNTGLIGATIYQNPSLQWYKAIRMLYDYIVDSNSLHKDVYMTDCSIIMKETLPLITRGSVSLIQD